jgi:hypothetical protein
VLRAKARSAVSCSKSSAADRLRTNIIAYPCRRGRC